MPDERLRSSTWRELEAIRFGLSSLGEKFLCSKVVKWRTDSQSAVRIVQHGSSKADLQALALNIFELTLKFAITLSIEWIPRSDNKFADAISRETDSDDWSISHHIFTWLDGLYGPHTVDCFANASNAKCGKFYSKYWEPGCTDVDGLSQSWRGKNC